MTSKKRVLVCANPDLNYIDGSSIWSQTISLALAETGAARVDFIAKSAPERGELFQPLTDHSSVTVINGTEPKYWNGAKLRRLTLEQMAGLAGKLFQQSHYDTCVVRGLEIATNLLQHPELLERTWIYLTDIPQDIADYTAEQRQTMAAIAHGCERLLCQTPGFIDLWRTLVPDLAEGKLSLYTPVIPDLPLSCLPIAERERRVIYAGKFKSDWKTLEMAESWPGVNRAVPDSQFVVIGDKIHSDTTSPDYKEKMTRALENTPSLNWLGALSREAVMGQLQMARIGLSWRSESMNDTVEYSTKILEYGAAGCAAIVNRNALHEQLLGEDYPLYANSLDEFRAQLRGGLLDDEKAQLAADRLRALAARHTFSARVEMIRTWLSCKPDIARRRERHTKLKILVAGHDLKFFLPLKKRLKEFGDFEFLMDHWQGHNKHNESASQKLLEKADIIFCEWCLGNIKWFSQHKRADQKLVARFHYQEVRLSYLAEADWEKIDHIAFVSEQIRAEAMEAFPGFPSDKTSVIPNFLDERKFTSEKKTSDADFTLGMIGVAPMRKRMDRALDLLETLLQQDARYCLRIKGTHPLDYGWLLKREEEAAYYKAIFNRINSSEKLRHRVIFDPPGDDVNEWLKMIGYILSPSDGESFHMAVGEGMLTGATPVIWNWPGADEIWPKANVVTGNDQAVYLVRKAIPSAQASGLYEPFLDQYSSGTVARQWRAKLQDLNEPG
ncbi:glycosyltransferase involved in cell wall biosynthesis [Pseudomonas nitritireducens]|uniref:Glycosyltransferase involved in cell wall biosynthesis n=1 Tax=Pseudomonas nitroreducens TaxID=46680 RepID=A0A7W7P223_PSENT|nr:glycosyltransferase [Pseudomonas nitritireducens]MBB4865101.1 glycosyltransferase involved in cell wall biosynthesis [Pseudomonas nitritireducens]